MQDYHNLLVWKKALEFVKLVVGIASVVYTFESHCEPSQAKQSTSLSRSNAIAGLRSLSRVNVRDRASSSQ